VTRPLAEPEARGRAAPGRAGRPGAAGGRRSWWVLLRWLRFNGAVAVVYVLLVVIWQLASAYLGIPSFLLPSPSAIVDKAIANPGQLLVNAWVTLQEVLIGFLVGVALSIPLGILVVYSRVVERVVYPFLVAFQATPKVALAPILVVWFGFGPSSKTVLALVTAAFPIVINTVVGMNQTPPEMVHLMRSFGASSWQIFVKARLPQAAPYIFGGFKIGITLAVVGAVVGEFIASNSGLGFLLLAANNSIDTPMLFAVVFALAVLSSALFYVIELAELLLLPRPLRRKGGDLQAGVTT
jgi:NitT/TauT family transport system permease protein